MVDTEYVLRQTDAWFPYYYLFHPTTTSNPKLSFQDGDFEKILSKDEFSLFKGEPKQPMNAFNFFIKKLSTEQKVDFKTAVQAYRILSKEEKDVYIEMSRKAKIQYKHDLATYLFSLPPDEQATYLTKLEAPKRTRVKKEKIVSTKNGDDVDEDLEDDEEIGLQSTVDFDDSTMPPNQIEVLATHDSADFDDAATADNRIEVIDVYTIKTEFDPMPSNNDHQQAAETSRATTKTKASEKASKSKPSGSKSLDNSRADADESSPSKGNSMLTESEQQTPRRSFSSKLGTDDESVSSNVSEKKKDKSHKRKRREEENEEIIDFENKKIKQEVEEPTRVPS